jgi:O-antigen ligase
MAIPRDPFRIGLFALTVLTISRVHQHFGFMRSARPALVLFLFSVGYLVLNPGTVKRVPSFRTWPAKVVLALGILACASVPFGMSIGNSATFILEVYSKVLIFALFLFIAIRRSGDLRFYMWAFVISAGILSYFALFVFDTSVSGSAVKRIQGMYTYDSNDLGVILMVALPLAILFFQTALTWRGKSFAGAVIIGIGMSAALSGSRGAFLGLIAVGLMLLFTLHRISIIKRLGFVITVVIALVLAAPPGYWEQMDTLREPTEDYNWESNYGRRKVWLRGLDYMWSNPLTGIGIDNFTRAEGTVSDPAVSFRQGMGERIKWSAAHNSFIQIGAELGVPGLIVWSSLLFGGLIGMRRLRRRIPSAWARGDPEQRFLSAATIYVPVSLVGFAVTASFVSFAYQDTVYVLAAYMAGVYVSIAARLRMEAKQRGIVSTVGRHPAERPREVAGVSVPAGAGR